MARRRSPARLDREIDEALAHRGHGGAHGYASRPHRGRRNPGRWRGTEVQSLLFERPAWTPSRAKAWAKQHHYRSGKVHVTDDYVRLRQFPPVAGTEKRTITFGDGIRAVIEQVK